MFNEFKIFTTGYWSDGVMLLTLFCRSLYHLFAHGTQLVAHSVPTRALSDSKFHTTQFEWYAELKSNCEISVGAQAQRILST